MQFSLDRLKEIIFDLKARLDLQPTFGWAVVTSVTPLMIRYDGQAEPIAGTPDRLATGLAVGDRVWCQRIYRRDIILGRAGGEPRKTGVVTQNTGALSMIGTSQVYGASFSFVIPVPVPSGSYVRVTCLNVGNGFGSISQTGATSGLTSTTVSVRFTQVGNSSAQQLTFLWEIVKPTET